MAKTFDIATATDEQIAKRIAWLEARNKDGKHGDAIQDLVLEQDMRIRPEPDADDEAEDNRRSVVRSPYKAAYRAKGTTKATKRGCGDWLHLRLIEATLDEKAKPIPGAFAAVCEANGIDVAKWQHLNPGQVRMCGGLALRKVVACNGALLLPCGERLEAPEGFCIRNGA